MDKKWRNCELHNINDAEPIRAVRKYCDMRNIQYETSDAGYEYTHFEILCTNEIARTLDAIIAGKVDYHF